MNVEDEVSITSVAFWFRPPVLALSRKARLVRAVGFWALPLLIFVIEPRLAAFSGSVGESVNASVRLISDRLVTFLPRWLVETVLTTALQGTGLLFMLGAAWCVFRVLDAFAVRPDRRATLRVIVARSISSPVTLGGVGGLLLLTGAIVLWTPRPVREKVIPILFVMLGLVFVGPWWRLWRFLRRPVWTLLGLYVVVFLLAVLAFLPLAFGAMVAATILRVLRPILGDRLTPIIDWLDSWVPD